MHQITGSYVSAGCYFYFEDVKEQDSLFRYVARGVLGAGPTRGNKAELVAKLKERGVFLIDLKADPVDRTPLADDVLGLIERCRALAPRAIILVKATVYDAAYTPLKRVACRSLTSGSPSPEADSRGGSRRHSRGLFTPPTVEGRVRLPFSSGPVPIRSCTS